MLYYSTLWPFTQENPALGASYRLIRPLERECFDLNLWGQKERGLRLD